MLIVGGGLAGMSLALFLADEKLPAMLVEQHAGTSALVRGRSLSLRSMEVYRAAGIEQALRATAPSVLRSLPEIAHADTLAGREVSRSTRPEPDSFADLSPTSPVTIDQNVVEAVLRRHAGERGSDLRFHTRLLSFAQDADGVTAWLRDLRSGRAYSVRTDYLVAADGHRSKIRRALGIQVSGAGTIGHYVNIPFEADLSRQMRGRRLALCYLSQPVPNTILTRLDTETHWVLMVPYQPANGERASEFTVRRCRALVRRAIGQPSLPVRLLASHLTEDGRIPTWELASWVADRFCAGRVVLVGDAAHVMAPAGGLGGNTGIQDAHNLAWKLAAVARGVAAPCLLETYGAERRQVALLTCEDSLQRQLGRLAGRSDADAGHNPLAVALGYRYRSAAVVPGAGDADVTLASSPDLDGYPGSRAPHLAVRRGTTTMSTIDLYGRTFVLMAGPHADRWAAAGRRVTAQVALSTFHVGHDIEDPTGRWAAVHGVTASGAVLVRPDGFVCWRSRDDACASDPSDVLYSVLRRALSHGNQRYHHLASD